MFGKEGGRTDEHRHLFWEGSLHISKFPIPLSSPLLTTLVGGQGAFHLFKSYPKEGLASGEDPEFPGSYSWDGCEYTKAGQTRKNGPPRLQPWPVTFSVDTQAPMVEPELTEVGELHSLTDWQVSDASEEAELEEFCSRRSHTRGPTHQTKPGATGKHN